jgi:hypothetical protein
MALAWVMVEAESLILQLLQQMRADIAGLKTDIVGTKDDIADVKSDITGLGRTITSDLMVIRSQNAEEDRQTRDQIVGLRRAVIEYHTSVLGHGTVISELEARVRRLEQNAGLPPLDAH